MEYTEENDKILRDYYNEYNDLKILTLYPSRHMIDLMMVLGQIEKSKYVDETIISYSKGESLEHLCEIRPSQKNTFANPMSMAKTKHEAIYTACLMFVYWHNSINTKK